MFDHSFPAYAFFFFLSRGYFAQTNSTFYARISPQWHTMLGGQRHSQPTPTSLGQARMRVQV